MSERVLEIRSLFWGVGGVCEVVVFLGWAAWQDIRAVEAFSPCMVSGILRFLRGRGASMLQGSWGHQ